MRAKRLLTSVAAAVASIGFSTSASAINLDNIQDTGFAAPFVQYDDGRSYSLPVLGILWQILTQGSGFTNSIQPGNPYYVNSSPGQIKDLTVIGTGSGGQPVTTNLPGMDDAYPTPNSDGLMFFTTNKTATPAQAGVSRPSDPGGAGEFTGDSADTWDIRLTALSNFLGAGKGAVFFFNNNQTNSGAATNQNLAIWAALTLKDDQGGLQDLNLYFSNKGGAFALVSEGGGGCLNNTATGGVSPCISGPDNAQGVLGAKTGPLAGTNAATDYVLSGGALCYTASLTIVSCSSPAAVGGPINHNLGANQAVYAVVFPKLNDILAAAAFGGYDSLSIDWRMGCDPAVTGGLSETNPNCTGRSLNNGYEQLFIASVDAPFLTPEPGTIALLGGSLLGLAALRRRRRA